MTGMEPQLSIHLVNFAAEDPGDWSYLLKLAKAADAAGVDRVNASDHVVFGEALDDYARPEVGGREGGKQPTGPDGCWLDPFTTLSVMAGMTSRIRLGTRVLLVALRRPTVLAKCAATLDVLSGGRFDLGVGVGWQKAEYDACGLDFAKRGRLLDHTLEVCQTLWRDRRASYASSELRFEAIHQMPKPTRPEGVPIWISGTIRDVTVRRLARFGTGWIPWGQDDLDMRESLPKMQDALAKAGGDPARLQTTGPLPIVRGADGKIDFARSMERVPDMVRIGQTDFVLPFAPTRDAAAAEAALREQVNLFRSAVGRPQVA